MAAYRCKNAEIGVATGNTFGINLRANEELSLN